VQPFKGEVKRISEMDPLTISLTVSSLVITILKTGKLISSLFDSFASAHRTLSCIQTECMAVSASLAQIQHRLGSNDIQDNAPNRDSGNGAGRARKWPQTPLDALDLSLLGFAMTIEILAAEINE
jgi:hypothetical protein